MRSHKRLFIAITLALAAAIISSSLLIAAEKSWGAFNDFPEYYAAIKMIAHSDGINIYNTPILGATEQALFPNLAGRSIGFFIPPFALPWLLPLSWLPLTYSAIVWSGLLIVALLASLLLLKTLYKLSSVEFFWLLALVSIFGPAFEAIRISQLSPLLLLSLLAATIFAYQKRPILSAFVLSFLLVKPQYLLPLVFYLLGAGQYAVILTLGLIAIIFAAIIFVLFGAQLYTNYFHLLAYTSVHSSAMCPEICPTFRGQLLRLFPQFVTIDNLISLILALLGLIIIFVLAKRFRSSSPNSLDAAICIALPLGLVTSLHCHVYDLLLLLPACVVFYKRYWTTLSLPIQLTIILALTAFLLPFYSYIHYYYLLKGGLVNPMFWILLFFVAEVCMLVKKQPTVPETIE